MTSTVRVFASAVLLAASSAAVIAQTKGPQNEGSSTSAAVHTLLPDCSGAGGTAPASPAAADDSKKGGFDLANLDRSVSPCADFYQFANGGWMKNNPIPAAYPRWGSFTILQEHNQDVLHTILEDAAKDESAQPGSNWQKIGDFYESCMDESGIEAAGIKPLAPEFERIAQMKDAPSLQAEVARLQTKALTQSSVSAPRPTSKTAIAMLAGIGQGGLGLPDRDYYTRDDEKSKKLRDEYVQHVVNMFKLLGDSDDKAVAEAKTVMDIETRLAKVSMPRVDLRDPDKLYHKMPVSQFQELVPNVDWEGYFKEIGAPPVTQINVFQPDFMKEVSAAWTSVPLADWKVYLRWQFVHAEATALPKKFVDENFDFYSRKLTGTTEILPRWRRCVRATDQKLGEDLGQFYVQRAFPPEAKAKALEMVHNLIDALRADLSTLDWMSPATREQATAKLSAIKLKIGYPDKWRDYSGYRVDRGPYVENFIRGNEFQAAYELGKIGKPVDRSVWNMTPPTVNAYYNSTRNEIVFPAGILQPPFYDPNRDDAMNYGGMGSVIGHELTHGFDDQGSKFDAMGNLKNWWTPEDLKNFQARGDCIVKQFDSFEVEPGLHENGKLVEGESIADLGGLTIAYAALQKTLQGKPVPAPIDGFTADQRFFLGWAAGVGGEHEAGVCANDRPNESASAG